ncbi:MAG: hypothetical protein ABIN89_20235 [Chitinophagaceae bacterium]
MLSRAYHSGTQSADTITDGSVNKMMLATVKSKLAVIAADALPKTYRTPPKTLVR